MGCSFVPECSQNGAEGKTIRKKEKEKPANTHEAQGRGKKQAKSRYTTQDRVLV
jgi:hypothetical protein